MPAKGYSLHIGVNEVDQEHYKGLSDLPSCENDAQAMLELAQRAQYQKSIIFPYTDEQGVLHRPTADALLSTLDTYSKELEPGDVLLFTYSGHGGQIVDPTGEEEDNFDETYCLYDRQLIDDEIRLAFCKFKEGVRIIAILDSCHSGTATKDVSFPGVVGSDEPKEIPKQIPLVLNHNINTSNAAVYEAVHNQLPDNKSELKPVATVKTFSACQDKEIALAGNPYSLFTQNLLDILGQDDFPKNYQDLFFDLEDTGTEERMPNYFQQGPDIQGFDQSIPFTFDGGTVPFEGIIAAPTAEVVELLVDFEEELSDDEVLDMIGPAFEIELTTTKDRSVAATKSSELALKATKDEKRQDTDWDLAYKAFFQFQGKGKDYFIEPNTQHNHAAEPTLSKSNSTANNYMPTWPAPEVDEAKTDLEFTWHLDEEHSQLAAARDSLMDLPAEERRVRIGHIDTGYTPEHPSTPEHVLADLGKSFVKGEEDNPGKEIWDNAKIEQDGHGLATLAILAGGKVTKEESYGGFEGYLGAVPFAEIVPIRIADSVALIFNTKTFAEGIYYAIEQNCDVVSMSMAGTPSRKWAKAINAAYEAGMIVVTAAGNNWRKGFKKTLPKVILYPSRFDRVISATGVCVNQEPYDFEANSHESRSKTAGGEHMQGNWGPKSAMRTAVAGYTPNLPWAVMNKPHWYSRSGGGTSSATPQVAATAALWIAKHRKELEAKGYAGTWKQVEAVKKAVFETADKSYLAYDQYYGHGAIKAMDALNFAVPEITEADKAAPAKIFFRGVKEFFSPFLQTITKSDSAGSVSEKLEEMAVLEITQLLYNDPSLQYYSKHLNLEEEGPLFENPKQAEIFRRKLKASPKISSFLKNLL